MSLEYHVPRILWENLEAVLLAQSKRYIGELAKLLHVSEKELLKQVLPRSDSLRVVIQDSHRESNQCCAYVQQDTLTIHCRKAVAYQSEFCPFHRINRSTLIEQHPSKRVTKIKEREDSQPMWVMDHTLINSNGQFVGTICPTEQRIRLFVLPSEPIAPSKRK